MSASDGPSDDPRVRAARTKRDRTRRALLDAADRLFGSRGWARTRMEDVAAEAAVSSATAYNHFATKHELVAHVYRPLALTLVGQAELDLEAGRPIVDALYDQVIALVRVTARERTLTAAFWSAVEEYGSRVRRVPEADDLADPRVVAPLTDALAMIIRRGQEIGELRTYPAAPEMAGVLVNIVLTRAVNRPSERQEDLVELLLTVTFGSLKPELLTAADGAERPFRVGG